MIVAVDGVDMLVGFLLLRAERECGYKTCPLSIRSVRRRWETVNAKWHVNGDGCASLAIIACVWRSTSTLEACRSVLELLAIA